MRLIDADKLLKCKCDCYDINGHLLLAVPTGYIVSAPTIDAAPVVHARWEEKMEHYGFVCCSVCHDCYVGKEWILHQKWGWCPNCGARMDGGKYDIRK